MEKLALAGEAHSASEPTKTKDNAPRTDPNADKTKDKNNNGDGASKLDAETSDGDDRINPNAHTPGEHADDETPNNEEEE